MAWFAYEIQPIDFGWDYLPTVEEIVSKCASESARAALSRCDNDDFSIYSKADIDTEVFIKDFHAAQEMATKLRWEGDFSHSARVLWLPDENTFVYRFVWKQANNGTTYVVSPHPLPWLREILFDSIPSSFPSR